MACLPTQVDSRPPLPDNSAVPEPACQHPIERARLPRDASPVGGMSQSQDDLVQPYGRHSLDLRKLAFEMQRARAFA